ncbi:MAG: AAA family ATPase [Candidatus Dormibacteraeota bacterium]|nr:AAA family ATPase [Candidatus Dormibacteraeota bacterium]
MIIASLKLKDFGIFYGTQPLPLKQGLYVIHGRNGRGKTTLLNAVRWALYGHYNDRQGRQVPPEVILNRQARREGTTEFAVELNLKEGADHYLLRRTQILSAAGSPPSQLYIERNGSPLTAGERERTIGQLLSEKVSRFFLFDGEQLQNYESLLFHEHSQLIKQSIEQILGLPLLDNALSDLSAIRDEFNKRLARLARQSQQLQQLGVRAEQAQNDRDSKLADIAQLVSQQEDQHGVIKEKDEFLQKYESSLDQLKNLETLDEKTRDLGEQRKSLRAVLAEQLRDAWRDVLAVAVQPKVQELRASLEKREHALVAQMAREQIERSLADGRCILCNQPLDAEHERHLAAELARQARTNGAQLGANPEDYGQLASLAAIVNTGHGDTAISLDRQIADLDSQDLALKQESARLRDALQNLPESAVTRAQKERDEAQQELGRLRSAIAGAEREKEEIEEKLRRAQEEIRRASGGAGQQGELSRALDLADGLRRTFEAAKGRFRDELRDAVEASATQVFRQLSNEPAFDRLKINDSYGLEIVNSSGEVVVGRSAGQEQVVALALIAALNRNARRRGPVMMDTPFGRLDPEHRTNILRFLSQFADQVFLLVHGGEVRDQDLAVIAGNINEQFDLQRDDTDRTTIVIRKTS